MLELRTVRRGDRVGAISPSAGLPAVFPAVYELGLTRLRNVFELEAVEYPTTRRADASLEERAHDIMAAFADSRTSAVFTSIGGFDQIQLLGLLDADVFRSNPKPFFGYSDNTHLHNYLWKPGIPSYYGGSVMTQLAMHGSMFAMTVDSLATALFGGGRTSIAASPEFNDEGLDWADATLLTQQRKREPSDGWHWDGEASGSGLLWGGCIESLIPLMGSNMAPTDEQLHGTVLYIETSEEIPPAWLVQYVLISMGERGWLQNMSAVLVGRPKAWEHGNQKTPQEKAAYKDEQRRAVVSVVRHYNPTIPVVQNMDFGHTDPQIVVPSGRLARVDGRNCTVDFDYGSHQTQPLEET